MDADIRISLFGDYMPKWAQAHRAQVRGLYDRCEQLSRESVQLLQEIEVPNNDVLKITVSCLFARSIEFYQGTVLLLSHGVLSPAQVSLRALLEATFTICAIVRSENDLMQYIAEDEFYRLKLANKLFHSTSEGLAPLRKIVTDELRATLKRSVEEGEISALSAEELARRAELHDLYLMMYTSLSPTVHSKPRDLQRYFVLDRDEMIGSFRFGPVDTDNIPLLCTAALSLLNAHVPVEKVLGKNIGAKQSDHRSYFEKVANKGYEAVGGST